MGIHIADLRLYVIETGAVALQQFLIIGSIEMISAPIGVMQNISTSIHSADSIACLSLACFSSI